MTETYEVAITLYSENNTIQYVTDDNGDIFRIGLEDHSFECILEHAFILDLEEEISKAYAAEIRSNADRASLLEMLDYSAAERLEAILRA